MSLDKTEKVMKIACIGECMVELSGAAAGSNTVNLGFAGDTMNTAVYLARLLQPKRFEIAYLTRLGQDHFSERALKFLQNEGVQTSHIGRDMSRNIGAYAIALDETGERSFTYWRSHSAARELFSVGTPVLSDLYAFDVIFLSAITLAILPAKVRADVIETCKIARKNGRIVAFDSNYRPALWEDHNTARDCIEKMWAISSIALPSLDDEQKLHPDLSPGQIIDRIAALGAGEIALKSGDSGPRLWPHHSVNKYSDAGKVVDTTGAGDSFDAGYLAARLTGQDAPTAAQMGHDLALEVIAKPGAIVDVGCP